MKIFIHQQDFKIADFKARENYLKNCTQEGLHLFPELFLTGYPLKDWCLSADFRERYSTFLKRLNSWSEKQNPAAKITFLLGGIEYLKTGETISLANAVFKLSLGSTLKCLYRKEYLPNEDIFDEKKYFTSYQDTVIDEIEGFRYAPIICEDLWHVGAPHSPIARLHQRQKESPRALNALIVFNASPFHLGKKKERQEQVQKAAQTLNSPVIYLNHLSAEDELLFDGESFYLDSQNQMSFAPRFQPCALPLEKLSSQKETPAPIQWCEAICFGLKGFLQKNAHQRVTIGVSGGIDSAVVLALAALALGSDAIDAYYLPSPFSSSLSENLAQRLCANLKIPLHTLSISEHFHQVKKQMGSLYPEGLSDLCQQNIQSRLRGLLLMANSNQKQSLVLNTSNKSELAMGYSTLYGDSIGALSLLGDLYKGEVYKLAFSLQERYGFFPAEVLTRAPSAELRPDQKDSDSLPPYEILDSLLQKMIEENLTREELCRAGHSREEVQQVYSAYIQTEYKRQQFPPILKLKKKSFGFGHRLPIAFTRD